MKHTIIAGFVAITLLQANLVSAGTGERPKTKRTIYASVNSEIKDLLDFHDFGDLRTTHGNVYVKYYVDQNNILHINQIGSTNPRLKEYVFKALDAQKVSTSNIQVNQEQTLKLNFELGSN